MEILSSGLLGGILASIILTLAREYLANWMVTLGVTLMSLGASTFFFYIYFFVGSSRPDAAIQMRYCLGLAIAFLFGAIVVPVWSFLSERARETD
jgi:hypothetical protein